MRANKVLQFTEDRRASSSFMLVVLIAFCILADPVSSFVPVASYVDEFIALCGFIVLFFPARWSKINDKRICALLVFYLLVGLLGALFFGRQPINAVLLDAFLSLKYFCAFGFGCFLFKEFGKSRNSDELLYCHTPKVVTLTLIILLAINFVFGLFPNQEMRFGIPIPRLFFSHSEFLASAAFLMMCLTIIGDKYFKRAWVWVVLEASVMVVTLRYKAIAAAIAVVFMYLYLIVWKKRIRVWQACLLCAIFCAFAWNQISLYYLSGFDTARGALTLTSFKIAVDYFPLGSGFASFGSHMSSVFYSPLYAAYGIADVYGLINAPGANSFITDTFWPMVLGQTGFFGLVSYVCALGLIAAHFVKNYSKKPNIQVACVGILIYALIQSTSSSFFVGAICVPSGLLLGYCYPGVCSGEEKNCPGQAAKGANKMDVRSVKRFVKRIPIVSQVAFGGMKAYMSIGMAINRAKFSVRAAKKKYGLSYGTKQLERYRDINKGEACLIVGSGPSLDVGILERAQKAGIKTISVNRNYRLYPRTTWRPNYYVSHDYGAFFVSTSPLDPVEFERGITQEVEACFLDKHFKSYLRCDSSKIVFFETQFSFKGSVDLPGFSDDPQIYVADLGTVSLTAAQIACYLGFEAIGFLGQDMSFDHYIDDDGNYVDRGADGVQNYAEGLGECRSGLTENDYVDVRKMNLGFSMCAKFMRENDIAAYNLTPGGYLEALDRMDALSFIEMYGRR